MKTTAYASFCLLFLSISIFLSCKPIPEQVSRVLMLSGKNRPELEKVITYFKKENNHEKLLAAYFLIGNMENKFSYDGDVVRNLDVLFNKLDSLHKKKVTLLAKSPVLNSLWDSLIRIYNYPSLSHAEKIRDYQYITASYLINNINESYHQWKSNPLLHYLSFDDYCEYILPYRVGTERIEPWRNRLMLSLQKKIDSNTKNNQFQIAKEINVILRKNIGLNHTINKYPFDMTASQMEMAKRGACKHLVNYEAMVMRANGIPVAIDETPLWGNMNRGHHWLTIIQDKKKQFAFNAAQDPFGGLNTSPYTFAKVYRNSTKTQIALPDYSEDIPSSLLNEYRKDVTSSYTKTFDINIKLKHQSGEGYKHAVICTFSRKWEAQTWGDLKDRLAHFKNMGANVVYIVMLFDGNNLLPATDPFILSREGTIRYLDPKQLLQDIVVNRKYPNSRLNKHNASSLLGGQFQIANTPDFKNALCIYTISTIPERGCDITGLIKGNYRYIRYLTKKGEKSNLAEMEIYTVNHSRDTIKLNGKILGAPEIPPEIGTSYHNVFDGDPDTYFSGNIDTISWAGLDLGSAKKIVNIRFYPRSDTNFLIPGDTYQLFMWEKDKWLSLGKTMAKSWEAHFKRVPKNSLLLLRNNSRGKEERIFTYERGKQVWW